MIHMRHFPSTMSHGSYVSYRLANGSARALFCTARLCGVKEPVPVKDMHVTLFTSCDQRIPTSAVDALPPIPATLIPVEGCTRLGKSSLVLKLRSAEIVGAHDRLVTQGYTHKFPDYQVHVTLAYDYPDDAPLLTNLWPSVQVEPVPVLEPYDDNWRPS